MKSGAAGLVSLLFIMAMRYAFLIYMEKQRQRPVATNGSAGQRSVEFWRESLRAMLGEALEPLIDRMKEQNGLLERMREELREGKQDTLEGTQDVLKELQKLRFSGRMRGGKDDSP